MPKRKLPSTMYYAMGAIILSQLIWAAASAVIKVTLIDLPPFTFLFLRFWIVTILLTPYVFMLIQKYKVDRRDYLNIFLLGIFSQSSIILIFWGLKYTTVLDSVIIGVLGPILSMAAGHYFYKEKVNKNIKIGVFLAVAGTILVVLEPILMDSPGGIPIKLRVLGNLLVLVYSLCFVLYIVWSKISLGQTNNRVKNSLSFIHLKPMKKEYPPNLLMTLSFFVGMVTMAPFAILENLGKFGPVEHNLLELGARPVMGLMYMAVFSSIIAYFLFEWALIKASVVDTAVLSYLNPILALPFAYFMLGELPTKVVLIGSLIITTGIFIAESKKIRVFFGEKL